MLRTLSGRFGVAVLIGTSLLATSATSIATTPHTARPAVDLRLSHLSGYRGGRVLVKPHLGGELDAQLDNRGTKAVRVRLTLTLPKSWTAKLQNQLSGERCRASSRRYSCDLRAVDNHSSHIAAFTIRMGGHVRYGQVSAIPMKVVPLSGHDANPEDNSGTAHAVNVGAADLVSRLTQSATEVRVGAKVHFTLTITNHGPDKANGLHLYFLPSTRTAHGFTQFEPAVDGTCDAGSANPVNVSQPYACDVGNIRSGATHTYRVTWRAKKVGAVGRLVVSYVEQGYDRGAHSSGGNGLLQYTMLRSSRITVTK